MLEEALSLSSYSLNWHAIPNVLAGLFLIGVAAYVDRSVKGARVGTLFNLTALAFASWLIYRAPMYAANSSDVALWWAGWMGFSLPLIGGSMLHFSLAICQKDEEQRFLIALNWLLCGAFIALQARGQGLVGGVIEHWWGYVPALTATGKLMSLWLLVALTSSLIFMYRQMLTRSKTSVMRKRLQSILLSQVVLMFAFWDALAGMGISAYQVGWLPAAISTVLLARAASRYQLVDITPALAGQRIIEHINEAVLVLDLDKRIRLTNDVGAALFDLKVEELVGRRLKDLDTSALSTESLNAIIDQKNSEPLEIADQQQANVRWYEFTSAVIDDENGSLAGYVLIGYNVTERKLAAIKLRDASLHDPLTGLGNRRLLQEELRLSLSRQARNDQREIALMFIDLDGFKPINDRYGHGAGDDLLKHIGQRLQQIMRSGDICARIGGDEFAIIAHGVHDDAALREMASRVLQSITRPITVDAGTASVGASIGAVMLTGNDTDALLAAADQAMYRAKRAGGNRVEISTTHDELPADDRQTVIRANF